MARSLCFNMSADITSSLSFAASFSNTLDTHRLDGFSIVIELAVTDGRFRLLEMNEIYMAVRSNSLVFVHLAPFCTPLIIALLIFTSFASGG